jgi:hypothetical protein
LPTVTDGASGEGSFHAATVGEVLADLAQRRSTGLLRVHGDDARLVAIADGEIYLATSASGPSIHQMAVGSGAAPEAAWSDASRAAAASGVAAALAADERVDGERLQAVLAEHIVSTLVELLTPVAQRYEWLPDQVHQLGPHFRFSAAQLLDEAGRRLATWRAISDVLPSTATRVRRSPTLPRGSTTAELTAVEWQVLSAMPEEGSVAEVIAGAGLSAFTVFDVLHRLVSRGLVRAVDGNAAAP